MRLLVDTGVFSGSISRRRRARFESQVALIAGNQALLAGWSEQCRQQLELSIAATMVVPVSDSLLTTAAELCRICRKVGHALHEAVHANNLWIAASAVHIGAPLLTADAVVDDVPGLSFHR